MAARYISEEDVAQLVTMADMVPAAEAAFHRHALLEVENIPRHRARTDRAMLHLMGAAGKTLGGIVVKAYTSSRTGVRFHLSLYRGDSGELRAIIAGDWLGALRTGAMSAVATRHLARAEATTVAIVGAGHQARTQLLAIAEARQVKAAWVYSRSADRRQAFAQEMSNRLNIPVLAAESAEACVRGRDIVCTATTSQDPVLEADWIGPGTHINAVGANFLTKSELPPDLVGRCTPIVVDDIECSRLEAGDFALARREGQFEWSQAVSLGQVVVQRVAGRTSSEAISLFKSVGVAFVDLAAALLVADRAEASGKGVMLPF